MRSWITRRFLPVLSGVGRDRRNLWLWVLLLAFAVRFAALLMTYPDKFFYTQYLTLGEQLRQNHFLAIQPFSYSPVYCYFLAFSRSVFGSLFAILLLQCCIGSLTCALIFIITRRLAGVSVALATACISCFYRSFVIYDVSFISDFLGLMLQLLFAAIWYWGKGKKTICFPALAGAVLGLCILQRPNSLLLLAFFLLWICLDLDSRRDCLARVAALVLCLLTIVAPVALQNMAFTARLSITYSSPGYVFYCSNNYACTGAFYNPTPLFLQATRHKQPTDERYIFEGDVEISTEIASHISGRPLSIAESSDFYFQCAISYFSHYPGEACVLFLRKLWLLVHGYEAHDTLPVSIHYRRIASITPFAYSCIAPLGLIGLFFSLKNWKEWLPLYAISINQAVVLLLFYEVVRFRLPVEAVFIILSGLALQKGWEAVARRRWRESALLLLATALAVWGCNTMDARMRETADGHYLSAHFLAGEVLLEERKYDRAISCFRDVLAEGGEDAPYAPACHNYLAQIYRQQGLEQQSREEIHRSQRSNGDMIRALEEKLKAHAGTPGQWQSLALLYEKERRWDSAYHAMHESHRLRPSDPIVRYHLARLQLVLGDKDMAQQNLEISLRDGLNFTQFGLHGCFYLAESYRRQNDMRSAERYYEQAARQAFFVKWVVADQYTRTILTKLSFLGYLDR